jgi:hypothetical protein
MTTPTGHADDTSPDSAASIRGRQDERLEAEFTLSEREILDVLHELREVDPAFQYQRRKAKSDAALGGCMVGVMVVGMGFAAATFAAIGVTTFIAWYFVVLAPFSAILIAARCWRRLRAVSTEAMAEADWARMVAMRGFLGEVPLRVVLSAAGVLLQRGGEPAQHIAGDAIKRTQSLPSGTVFFDGGDQLMLIVPGDVVRNIDMDAFLRRHAATFPSAQFGGEAWLIDHLREHHEPCPQCRYDLHDLVIARCPECGLVLTRGAIEASRMAV